MILKELIEKLDYELVCGDIDTDISSITSDSRKVIDGTAFICIKGYQSDGHAYIGKAIENGATALIVMDVPDFEAMEIEPHVAARLTIIQVADTRLALAYMSAAYFGYPAKDMEMIALTGTKGKTTTAHMIKSILEAAGNKVGMIGTVGAFVGDVKYPTNNTTPESYELHSLFRQMKDAGCTHVVMEVSSQALKLHRTAGIHYDYALFLNLSPDHIGPNEHADFNEYRDCKKMLFSQTDKAIVNYDDENWQYMTENVKDVATTSSQGNSEADYYSTDIKNIWRPGFLGVDFKLHGKLEESMELNIPGAFNVENALLAIAFAHESGIKYDDILEGLRTVYVKGRSQLVKGTEDISTFIIDYAHNALSMENILTTLRTYNPKRLICMFGAGGCRARDRRFGMGRVSGKLSDLSVVTMDNPRTEPVADINADIVKGIEEVGGKYIVIEDRREAIHYLIENANKDDIVVFAGKGHEEYIEINNQKFDFSEEQVVKEYVEKKRQENAEQA